LNKVEHVFDDDIPVALGVNLTENKEELHELELAKMEALNQLNHQRRLQIKQRVLHEFDRLFEDARSNESY